MRLLIVSSRHHPSQGGIGAAVWWLIHHATHHGWQIDLMTRPGAHLPPATRLHLVETPDEAPEFASRIAALRRIDRIRPYRYGLWSLAVARALLDLEGEYDAIQFVDSQAEGYVALTSGRVRDRWRDVPMCVWAHTPMSLIDSLWNLDSQRFGRSIYASWEQAALQASDGVIVPSRMLRDALKCRNSTAIIPNLLPDLPPDDSPKNLTPIVLLVGNIEPNKGVDIWARSLNLVLARHEQANAILIGADTPTAPDGGSMATHVHQLLNDSARERFRWIGPCSEQIVTDCIKRASVVVVASRFESFSYVAAQAVISGRPVVITDRVGIREYAASLECVPYGDLKILAAAQLKCLTDHSLAQMRITQTRDELLSSCSPRNVLNTLESFVHGISPHRAVHGGVDSIEKIHRMLIDIEIEERAHSLTPQAS